MNWPFFHPSPVVEIGRDESIQVQIRPDAFSAFEALEGWSGAAAASAVFLGRVRPQTLDGEPLQALELQHYPGFCERQLLQLAREQLQHHGAMRALVVHRVGTLLPGELIVLVAVEADRRGSAQRCCGDLLEALKHQAPFWKREWCSDQGTWLSGNTPL